jgi:hypothetical protein
MITIEEAERILKALRSGTQRINRPSELPPLWLVPDFVERSSIVWSIGVHVGDSRVSVKRIAASAESIHFVCS